VLKSYFDLVAEEEGLLTQENPVRLKRHAAKLGRRLPRCLSDDEVARLWQVLECERDRALVALMLGGGLRVSEVVGLSLQDIFLPLDARAMARLRVQGKGQKERLVYLSGQATSALLAWLAVRPALERAAVFLSERGQALSVAGVQWLMRGYGERIGVALTPHRLRHTFARQLIEAEMPVESLARLMGHAQISTTQTYLEGANLALGKQLQEAMVRLEAKRADPVVVSPSHTPHPSGKVPAEPDYPLAPDGSTWALDLPQPIRQACLSYLRRQLGNWRPSRRRERAQHLLADLAGFWRWLLARRPLTQVSELSPEDVRAYLGERLSSGRAPATVKRVLDRLLGLLRQLVEEGQAISPAILRLRPPQLPDALPRALSELQYKRLENQARRLLDEPTTEAALDGA
jgi:site-specific recombinase XerD